MSISLIFLLFGACFVQSFAEFSCDFNTVHGTPAQPADTLPYQLNVSSFEYSPGTTITVSISGAPFRGFYVRAFDEETNEPLGSWSEAPLGRAMDTCNAIMQADREDKESVELKWKSPHEGTGKIYFRSLIMKDYSTYWSNIESRRSSA